MLIAYDGHPDVTSSPRQVNTKYGTLRGVIIPLSRDSSSTTSGTSSQRPSTAPVSSSFLSPVEAFFGVPYASPPINTLRFMPPVTPSHWRGVRLANRFGPVCPQKLPDIGNTTEALKIMSSARVDYLRRVLPFMRNQSEDCLYLNIYVPHLTSTTSTSGEFFKSIHINNYLHFPFTCLYLIFYCGFIISKLSQFLFSALRFIFICLYDLL